MEKGQGRGRGSAGEDEASFGSPGGLPLCPCLLVASSWRALLSLQGVLGAFGEGVVISALALPLAQTMASTSPCLPTLRLPWALHLDPGPHRPVQLPSVASTWPQQPSEGRLLAKPFLLMQARVAFAFSFLQLKIWSSVSMEPSLSDQGHDCTSAPLNPLNRCVEAHSLPSTCT